MLAYFIQHVISCPLFVYNTQPSTQALDKKLSMFIYMLIGVTPTSFSDWEKIDKVEIQRGKAKGKPREKVVSLKEMMEIIAP